MKATQDLIGEHNAVLVALQILEKIEESLVIEKEQASLHLEPLLDFFTGFVDRCHHAKEEDIFFPELQRRGMKRDGGPIGIMLLEHAAGRAHVRAMSDGLERLRRGKIEAVTAIREHAHAYVEMLRAHIYKENTILFPMADQVVPQDVAARLALQFDEIERDRIGEGKHEEYHRLLHELKEHYGVL